MIAPAKIGIASAAASSRRRRLGIPPAFKLAIVANPSGMSAVTWPSASSSASVGEITAPVPIISPSVMRSTEVAK